MQELHMRQTLPVGHGETISINCSTILSIPCETRTTNWTWRVLNNFNLTAMQMKTRKFKEKLRQVCPIGHRSTAIPLVGRLGRTFLHDLSIWWHFPRRRSSHHTSTSSAFFKQSRQSVLLHLFARPTDHRLGTVPRNRENRTATHFLVNRFLNCGGSSTIAVSNAHTPVIQIFERNKGEFFASFMAAPWVVCEESWGGARRNEAITCDGARQLFTSRHALIAPLWAAIAWPGRKLRAQSLASPVMWR